MRNTVAIALFCFFMAQFLKVPDMALGEVYENVFTPISRSFYFAAIVLLGYVYVRELLLEREQHLHHLEGMVQNRTQALENALKDLSISNDKLSELSLIDQLTGLGNRRNFDIALRADWDRARRDKTTLSLLLIDLDYFKAINDSYGHAAGDAWLRNIASYIKQAANRASDVAVRFGGDEFAVILPNTNQQGAVTIAESLCQAVAQNQVEWQGATLAGTISVGVASMIPDTADGFGSQALIANADHALYQAKANGRNQVSV
jgi:two-component system, sensor histidine kinase LadS